jgi:hypothetical protein
MESEPKERRYLVRRPKALQYFHNGQLKKAAEKERVAGRFELFFDLLCMSTDFQLLSYGADGFQMLLWYVSTAVIQNWAHECNTRSPTSQSI